MLQLAFWLVASHALCDFALQPDAMARGKSRRQQVASPLDRRDEPHWLHWLWAHALIHGAGVAGVLSLMGRGDLWWLGLAEAVCHAGIDHIKSERRISMNLDQVLHLACKAAWLGAAAWIPVTV